MILFLITLVFDSGDKSDQKVFQVFVFIYRYKVENNDVEYGINFRFYADRG